MKSALVRVLPVGLALSPVGFLFGVLAAQTHWKIVDVFLLSTLGFTGSGQFAFLAFTQQGVESIGVLVIFVVILSMNLRYIPMSLSASQPLRSSFVCKLAMSHCLADESYATEKKEDGIESRAVIRAGVFLFWVVSTVAGCALASYLPASINSILAGLTFPVSAILFALGFMNVLAYVQSRVTLAGRRKLLSVVSLLACFAVVAITIQAFGERFFWLPSIAVCYILLSQVQRSGRS
jgi:predicted branched-subunit amino acid permease